MLLVQSRFLSLNRVHDDIEHNPLPNMHTKYACHVLEHCIPLFIGLLCCVSSTFGSAPNDMQCWTQLQMFLVRRSSSKTIQNCHWSRDMVANTSKWENDKKTTSGVISTAPSGAGLGRNTQTRTPKECLPRPSILSESECMDCIGFWNIGQYCDVLWQHRSWRHIRLPDLPVPGQV